MASIVVPDLHGCPHFLEWVLRRFPERHFILLGDLIHRGPDSRRVLREALELGRARQATLLWGNHEEFVWRGVCKAKFPEQRRWLSTKGQDLLRAYQGDAKACLHDLTQFALLARPYVVEGEMLCAHAARPSLGVSPDDLLDQGYLRDRPNIGLHPLPTQFYPDLRYSVHGHTVFRHPVIDLHGEGVVYLDLGSAKTGRFCVWDAQERQVLTYGKD